VKEEIINNVKLSCLQWENVGTPPAQIKPSGEQNKFLKTAPSQSDEMTDTVVIKGIPEVWMTNPNFVLSMPEKVFKGLPLQNISALPNAAPSMRINFEPLLNLQKLPEIASRLETYLKNEHIPSKILTGVTIQYMNEKKQLIEWEGFNSKLDPVVGLIFKGIPKNIIKNFHLFSAISSEVLTIKQTVWFMDPIEKDWTLRILLKTSIHNTREISAIVQRMKRLLSKRGVSHSELSSILVMSFSQGKWDKLNFSEQEGSQRLFNPNDYVGVEIDNMPTSVVDSDVRLERLKKLVFGNQRVAHISIMNMNTLRISFVVSADKNGMERTIRDLKLVLSQMEVPRSQINKVLIIPHKADTWAASLETRKIETIRQSNQEYHTNLGLQQNRISSNEDEF